jgi:excisionase family DNA binding protein
MDSDERLPGLGGLVTLVTASERLGIPVWTLRRLVRRHRLAQFRLGRVAMVRFSELAAVVRRGDVR